jgi:hypothetical protein
MEESGCSRVPAKIVILGVFVAERLLLSSESLAPNTKEMNAIKVIVVSCMFQLVNIVNYLSSFYSGHGPF